MQSNTLKALADASRGGTGEPMVPAMALALQASFGSVERWREGFAALARVQASGTDDGAVVLAFRADDGRLHNAWVAGPEVIPAADGVPMLAFFPRALESHGADDPSARADRVEAALDDIDWAAAYGRYQHAVDAASEAFGAEQTELGGAVLVDVRRAGVFENAATRVPGASWRDPADVATWAAQLPANREVVVYCVYGHEVGRATALRLRGAGVNARFLRGGIDGWQAAGRPLESKQDGA